MSRIPVGIVGFLQFYNELQTGNLPRVVANLRQFCDAVVGYDDGSIDGSGYWADENLDLVVHGAENDWPSEIAHKAKLLDATLEVFDPSWVAWLDCDEEFSPAAISWIVENCTSKVDRTTGVAFLEANLWRSKTHVRVDSHFWGKSFIRLWRANGPSRLSFAATQRKLHSMQYPPAAGRRVRTAPERAPVLHYSWDSPEKIEAKHRLYTEVHGMDREVCARLLDGPKVQLRRVHADWWGDGPLAFVHIGRTGGVSVRKVLQGIFGARLCVLDSRAKYAAREIREVETAAYAGHVQAPDVPSSMRRITVLRDPAERFVSEFYFIRKMSDDHELRDEALSWEKFLSSPITTNAQVRALAGVPAREPVRPTDLAPALRALYGMTAVGVTEDLASFVDLLSARLGWTSRPPIPRLNSAPGPRYDEWLEAAGEANALDAVLYETAKRNLL